MSGKGSWRKVTLRKVAMVVVAVSVAFFFGSLIVLDQAIPDWTTTRAFGVLTETQQDMVLDSKGNPVIACSKTYLGHSYCLSYANLVDGEWTVALIENISSDYWGVSIALDSRDKAYVVTGGPDGEMADTGHLTFATDRSGSWTVEDIGLGYRFYNAAVGVDSQDRVHILCAGAEFKAIGSDGRYYVIGHFEHFYEEAGAWKRVDISGPTGNVTWRLEAFKMGPNDSMHALVLNLANEYGYDVDNSKRTLTYATNESGAWTLEAVPEAAKGGPYFTSVPAKRGMAIDEDGRAHICNYAWNNDTKQFLMSYVTNKNGSWTMTNLTYAGNCYPTTCSIDVDSKGAVHIAYYAQYFNSSRPADYNETERYVTNSGGSWKQVIIDDVRGWTDTQRICVAVGPDGKVHLSYFANLGVYGKSPGDVYTIMYSTPTDKGAAFADAGVSSFIFTIPVAFFATLIGLMAWWIHRRRTMPRKMDEEIDPSKMPPGWSGD